MKFALIGRSELSYDSALLLIKEGHELKLVVTAKEAPEYKYTSLDFKRLADLHGATFVHSATLTRKDVESHVLRENIPVAVSVNYSGIISSEVISLFPLGILNAHSGDLPRYRGNACQAWAIINGEDKIGLCIHKMIGDELDSGDIIDRAYFPLTIDTRVGEAFNWMTNEIPGMMSRAIKALSYNPHFHLETQSKDPQDALRCYPRRPEDGRIDWNHSAVRILRLINASSEPYRGAFGLFDKKEITIWRAQLYSDSEKYVAVPGQIGQLMYDGDIVVITGDGKLILQEVEIDGERFKPGNFIKSIRKRFY